MNSATTISASLMLSQNIGVQHACGTAVEMANLTIAELKSRATEALQTDGFTDIEIRRVGKDGNLYVGRGHANEEAIIIFLRTAKR